MKWKGGMRPRFDGRGKGRRDKLVILCYFILTFRIIDYVLFNEELFWLFAHGIYRTSGDLHKRKNGPTRIQRKLLFFILRECRQQK